MKRQNIHLIRYGGPEETRTPDPRIANAMLFQLSYGPDTVWAYVDSNHRPQLYQSCALAN